MPKVLDEDQLRRKKLLEEKRAARRKAKADRDAEASAQTKDEKQGPDTSASENGKKTSSCRITELPEDPIRVIFNLLTAQELGRLVSTCKTLNRCLTDARTSYVLARTRAKGLELCRDEAEARQLVEDSYGGGDTERIVATGKYAKATHNEFCSYARFLQEITAGYSHLDTGAREPILLPPFVQGRFISVSPEHTIVRVGGDGKTSGAGGSGLASWGVGKRGQLGHGKREDQKNPKRLIGGIGYGIRIVQVSAGGGLVRVAHSLLLTSTGRVLSFGVGQYGALGHGYSAAKQLPDQLRPKYIEGLNGIRCVCVAAGELHSAVVSTVGDVYSWGDGFCGQLGHGDKRPQLTPRQITKGGLEDESIANITCGSRHTIAVSDDGEVFSWGLGHFGVLGRSFTPFDYDADAAVVAFTGEGQDPVAVQPPPPDAAAPAEGEAQPRDLAAELVAHLDLIANLSLDDSSDQCIPRPVDSLSGIRMVGASAGHRHSLFLDESGGLYSCGAGQCGCLGHGDTQSQMFPMKITSLEDRKIRIIQMSAGVDISMALSSTGDVYGWGKTNGGRLGLGLLNDEITAPRQVVMEYPDERPFKAADVECGYVHSMIVGLDGTIHMCGGVGVEGEADGQQMGDDLDDQSIGKPRMVQDINIWHRTPEPKEDEIKKERWKKLNKYEVRGRSKMMSS